MRHIANEDIANPIRKEHMTNWGLLPTFPISGLETGIKLIKLNKDAPGSFTCIAKGETKPWENIHYFVGDSHIDFFKY